MGIMNIISVLLLCILAASEWISCEASRKMFMEGGEVEGNGGLLPVSRKILSEAGEETNDMETELMLPEETDSENLEVTTEEEIVAEQKNTKQEEPWMEARKEQKVEKQKKKQHQEGELIFPKSGDGDLLLETSEEEKWAGEKSLKKEKEYGIGKKGETESFAEQESTGQLMADKMQQEGKGGIMARKKAKDDMEDLSLPSQTSEEEGSFNMERGEEAEGFPVEASLADITETEMETGVGSFLSEVGEEENGGNRFKEKLQTEEQSGDLELTPRKHQGSVEDTNHYKEKDAKENPFKQKKGKKKEVEGSVKAKKEEKAHVDEAFKSEVPDDKASKGFATAEEIRDEDTPADVIEREMQGGVEDLVTKAVEEEKVGAIVEEKQKTNGKAGTTSTKHGSSEESTQSEGGEAKKKSSKKTKTSKQSKSEFQALEEENAELEDFKSSDGNGGVETKVKKKKNKSSSSDLLLKNVDTQDMAKSKVKKKKAKSSEKTKKEDKSSEKAKKKSFNKKTEESSEESESIEVKEGKEMPKPEILHVVDINAKTEEDTRKQKQSEVEKPSEDELPTIEKQEEKLEVEVEGIAKDAQERAEGSVSTMKSVSSSTQGVDEEDDEYGDFMQDFSDFSTKFQDTALKVADHIGPNIQKLTDTSKNYFNKANQQITESFSPLVGKQFAPFLASLISYGLLLVPLAVVVLLFENIRALLSLQKVLLFVNIYLAAYFATLLLATFIIGEPMNFFYKSSASGYIHLQLLQALGYIVYLILQTFDLVFSCSSETLPVKVTVVLQWFVAFTIGFHYYVTIFHRAMALKGPHTNWKIYGIYSIAFLVLCLFARIKRVKKGYSQLGQVDTDKKH